MSRRPTPALRLLLSACALAATLAPGAPARAAANPAAEYCTALGYEWVTRETAEGTVGLCRLPDGSQVEEWEFLSGRVAASWNACDRLGLATVLLSNDERCRAIHSPDCAACRGADGAIVEVSTLVAALSLSEGTDAGPSREAGRSTSCGCTASGVEAVLGLSAAALVRRRGEA